MSQQAKRLSIKSSNIFLIIGLGQTIFAYLVFSRADDHTYFLEVANFGLSAVPEFNQALLIIKAQIAAYVFYSTNLPARLLGGHELIYILWLRLLTLLSFIAFFNWLQSTLKSDVTSTHKNKKVFFALALIYPGQLAWTASLLRDGAATAFLLFGISCLRRHPIAFFSLPFFGFSLALRPEYILILVGLGASLITPHFVSQLKWRAYLFPAIILAFSVATHSLQSAPAAFGQLAFSDAGLSYPQVIYAFDISGYLKIFAQGMLDPIPLSNPITSNPFAIGEVVFFIYLISRTPKLILSANKFTSNTTLATLFVMWVYAYFEIFVSGFSRHRLCLTIILIGIYAASLSGRRRTNDNQI